MRKMNKKNNKSAQSSGWGNPNSWIAIAISLISLSWQVYTYGQDRSLLTLKVEVGHMEGKIFSEITAFSDKKFFDDALITFIITNVGKQPVMIRCIYIQVPEGKRGLNLPENNKNQRIEPGEYITETYNLKEFSGINKIQYFAVEDAYNHVYKADKVSTAKAIKLLDQIVQQNITSNTNTK